MVRRITNQVFDRLVYDNLDRLRRSRRSSHQRIRGAARPVFIGPGQIALAHTPAEAAHIRLHFDRLMKEGQPA
jgi:hypothetical protein